MAQIHVDILVRGIAVLNKFRTDRSRRRGCGLGRSESEASSVFVEVFNDRKRPMELDHSGLYKV